MTATANFQLASTKLALWMNENPVAARVAMIVVPAAIALAVALMTGTTAYACPAASSGTGGCGS